MKEIHSALSLLLAAAAAELFPGAHPLVGQGTSKYFFYTLTFPFPFQQGFLPLIEERMRQILREGREMVWREMATQNAADWMRHRKEPQMAELLERVESATVHLCQIGEVVLYVQERIEVEWDLPYFRLIEGVEGPQGVRLIGVAGDKGAIKAQLKARNGRSRLDTEMMVSGEGGVIWRPKGERVRQAMIRWWRSRCGGEVVCVPGGSERELLEAHREYFLRYQEARVAQLAWMEEESPPLFREGFLTPAGFWTDRTYLFCPDEQFLQECISSLHFILQLPKILDFEFEIVLTVSLEASKALRAWAQDLLGRAMAEVGVAGKVELIKGSPWLSSIEVRILDVLGRSWPASFVGIPLAPMPAGRGRMLVRSSWGSFERMLALLLEKGAGVLPAELLTGSGDSEPTD